MQNSELTIIRGGNLEDVIIPITEASKRVCKLMGEDYITLEFYLPTAVFFPIGSYCFIPSERYMPSVGSGKFIVTDLQNPTPENGAYKYELKMERYYMIWKNRLYKYSPNYGSREASWSLTASLGVFLSVLEANLKKNGYKYHYLNDEGEDCYEDYVCSYATFVGMEKEFTESVALSFNNVSIYNALTQIAEAYKCEWWVEDNNIKFGKCELSTPDADCIALQKDINVEALSVSSAKEASATRMYCFGSEKNIPSYYRKVMTLTCTKVGVAYDSSKIMKADYFKNVTKTLKAEKSFSMNVSSTQSLAQKKRTSIEGNRGNQRDGDYYYVDDDAEVEEIQKYAYTIPIELSDIVGSAEKVLYDIDVSVTVKMNDVPTLELYKSKGGFAETDLTLLASKEYESASSYTLHYADRVSFDKGDNIFLKFNTNSSVSASSITIESSSVKFYGISVSTTLNYLSGTNKGESVALNIPLEDGNVDAISPNVNIVVGDTFNFTDVYRGKLPYAYYVSKYSSDIVQNGVVATRLMLPDTEEYPYNNIDLKENLSGDEIIEEILTNDDIYPRMRCKISDVSTTEYQDTEELSTGEKSKVIWTAYRFTLQNEDGSAFLFSNNYRLDGKKLQGTFKSGSLNGMTFDIEFNPEGYTEDDDRCQLFEIIRNEDYGRPIPDSVLKPKVGDEIVLFNYDTEYVDNTLIAQAEAELAEKMKEYIERRKIDNRTFDVTMMCDPKKKTDMIPVFQLGSRVKLIDNAYFDEGYRYSRVIGIECKLDYPYDHPQYTIGESHSYSRLKELANTVEEIKTTGASVEGIGSGSGFSNYIIKRSDSTAPSDDNVFSALRSVEQFLSKKDDDTAEGYINFLKGLCAYVINTKNINVSGDARSQNFKDSLLEGLGWRIDSSGNAQLESLEVRSSLKVLELVYNRLSAQEGDTVFTEGGTIEDIEYLGEGKYKIWIERRNDTDFHAFRLGDVLRGKVSNLSSLGNSTSQGVYSSVWLRVTEVSSNLMDSNHFVALAYGTPIFIKDEKGADTTDIDYYDAPEKIEGVSNPNGVPNGKNYPPTMLMTLHRWGNAIEPSETTKNEFSFIVRKNGGYINERQSAWYISSYEKRIVMLDGVKKPILDEENYSAFLGLPFNMSSFKNHSMVDTQPYLYVRGAFLQDVHYIDYNGVVYKQERFRGVWDATTASSENDGYLVTETTFDTVYYNNIKWQCNGAVGQYVRGVPTDEHWIKLQESGDVYSVELSTDNGIIFKNGTGTTTISVKVYCGSTDITDTLDDSKFTWERVGTSSDATWNAQKIHGKTLVVSSADVKNKVQYTCKVEV